VKPSLRKARALAWFAGDDDTLGAPLLLVVGLPSLVAVGVGVWFAEGVRPSWDSGWAILARVGLVLGGAVIAQLLAPLIVGGLRTFFDAKDSLLDLPKNKRPQRLLGVVENITYPWLLFALDKEAAVTAIGVWLAAKVVGSWTGWESDDKADPHKGRRVLYAFLLANAFQIACASAVATAMGLVK
jgi:hypothetical protein